ncbi:MAG: HAD family hydrolase [Rhodospirillales bacterium]|nr:MAG: HAD family hydrolase [Rhodospirillales bacterium]
MTGSPPQALIFDWDNTLVDSWACILDSLNVALDAMGHAPWTLDEMHVRVALSLRDHFPVLFGERWEEARDIFYGAFRQNHLERLKPIEGMDGMLASLHAKGFKMSVVSNKNGEFLRAEAERLGWSDYFHRLVGATDAPRDKPAPEPVHLALEGTGIAPGPWVWFVGDAAVDMECALAANCVPVLLRPLAPRQGEFDRFTFRHYYNSPRDLVQALITNA